MSGLSDAHDDNGDSRRQRCGQPAQGVELLLVWHETEQFGDAQAGQGAKEVTEDEGARLREGTFHGPEDQDGRCSLCESVSGVRMESGSAGQSTDIRSDDTGYASPSEVVRVVEDGLQHAEAAEAGNEGPQPDHIGGQRFGSLGTISQPVADPPGQTSQEVLFRHEVIRLIRSKSYQTSISTGIGLTDRVFMGIFVGRRRAEYVAKSNICYLTAPLLSNSGDSEGRSTYFCISLPSTLVQKI